MSALLSSPAASTEQVAVAIRPATAVDAIALAPLLAELGYPTEADVVQERLQQLEQTGGLVLLAMQESRAIGALVLYRTLFLHRPPDGRIASLVVTAHCRGLGIGAQLVAAAEQQFRAWGCARVEVSSGAQREAAHRFYRRIGYEEQAKRFIKQLAQ